MQTSAFSETAICIASGPSLTQKDVDYCQGKGKVYVVNDCHRLAPWADVLYACDPQWWNYHQGVPQFKGEKWTLQNEEPNIHNLNQIPALRNAAWSSQKDKIVTGNNSGFQVMNLAANFGAKKIILLGYDMGYQGDKKHWFGDHPDKINTGSNFPKWIEHFRDAAPLIAAQGIEVINCTRRTALQCFRAEKLEDVL